MNKVYCYCCYCYLRVSSVPVPFPLNQAEYILVIFQWIRQFTYQLSLGEFWPRPSPIESGRVFTCHFSVKQAEYLISVVTQSISQWSRQGFYVSLLTTSFFLLFILLKQAGYLRISSDTALLCFPIEAGRVFTYQLSSPPFPTEASRVFTSQFSSGPFFNEASRVFTCYFSPRPFFLSFFPPTEAGRVLTYQF